MTKKTENTVVADAVKASPTYPVVEGSTSETSPVEAQAVQEAPVVPEQVEAPVDPAPEPAIADPDSLIAAEDLADDERSEEGTDPVPGIQDWDLQEGGEENTWQPSVTNFENSRTLPWSSDPYGLLTGFRDAASAAAFEVSGKDEYVDKLIADLDVLTKHIHALNARTKIERKRLVEQQIELDRLAREEHVKQQRARLEELKREAASIKEDLADE